jgi:hypothetical protein
MRRFARKKLARPRFGRNLQRDEPTVVASSRAQHLAEAAVSRAPEDLELCVGKRWNRRPYDHVA